MSLGWLYEGIVHWESQTTNRPICGAVGKVTNLQSKVTCLLCVAYLEGRRGSA